MNKQVNKFLQIAYAEIGYVEKASNKNLDSKTGNPGKGNYTKYGRDLKAWTGSKAYGIDYQWCDQFYDWVMVKAFGLDEAKRLLGGWSAYTPTSAQYHKDKNRWHTGKDCLPGDQIFFKNSVRICHTGAVYRTDDTYIYTVEGNTNPGRSMYGVIRVLPAMAGPPGMKMYQTQPSLDGIQTKRELGTGIQRERARTLTITLSSKK